MIGKRLRGNTMALYAAFLVTVGIPLLAMGVDVSRVYLMQVRLRNATQAACQAYGNSLDIRAFQMEDELRFSAEGVNATFDMFNRTLGDYASFVPVVNRKPGEGLDLGDGTRVEIVVVQCFGTAFVDAVVPFFGNYTVTSTTAVKTKFSTTKPNVGN